MAGKIIADTLETGAGAEISTSYVVNGSAKAWLTWDDAGSTGDSLNVSSVTDVDAGAHTPSWSSSFGNTGYSATGTGSKYNNATQTGASGWNITLMVVSRTTSDAACATWIPTSPYITDDYDYTQLTVHGDLA